METTYKIVRMFYNGDHRQTIETELSLEEAQEHCRRPDTHGGSTDDGTAWFDGYEEE